MIHAKNLHELKFLYLRDSIKVAKTEKRKWTPLRWMLYKERLLKKRGEIRDYEIEALVHRLFPECVCLLPDYRYWVTNGQDYIDFLIADDTDKAEYISDYYDCDDFAWRLMGKLHHPLYGAFAHGVVWSQVHAFNGFIDWTKNLYFIEPQNDEICRAEELSEDKSYYPELIIL